MKTLLAVFSRKFVLSVVAVVILESKHSVFWQLLNINYIKWVGETGGGDQQLHSEQDYYRVSAYYSSLDMVTTELKSRFDKNDQDVLVLWEMLFSRHLQIKTASRLFLGTTALTSIFLKKKIFLKFIEESKSVTPERDSIKVETAADLVQTMRLYDLDSVLPVFWKVEAFWW